jgi:putative aldouronate transport system permease protein
MMLPALVWLAIFCYGPLYGILIAFKDYNPGMGITHSPFVGLKYFAELFSDKFFINALRNTLLTSLLKLVCGFPIPIAFAILLNEVMNIKYKRIVQTVSYMPYFLSWAFVAAFLKGQLLADGGLINTIALGLGLIKEPVSFLGSPGTFYGVIVLSYIWKDFGFSSIIYLAAITSIDPQLYEAAVIDGATRWQRIWNITLPTIKPTVVVLLILSSAGIINANFEQFYLLQNDLVLDWVRVINVYTYEIGLKKGRFSYGTTVGLFTSITSFVLLIGTNYISGKLTGESIY